MDTRTQPRGPGNSRRSGDGTGAAAVVRDAGDVLTGADEDFDTLMRRIGDAQIVLVGEASHGTRDFYEQRAGLTRRLISEKGFSAVAVEGDWPDSWQVNRYVRGEIAHSEPRQALAGFRRFPTWMWRNTVMVEFVTWLRLHNSRVRDSKRQVGFYGLDLYSLYQSVQAVIEYLEQVDPAAALKARERYSCFEGSGSDSVNYGRQIALGVSESCRREAISQLVSLQRHAADYLRLDGFTAEDHFLNAEVNARTINDAEEYYRSMFTDPTGSWNLRDRHMADTLDRVVTHLEHHGDTSKVVVWAHNSHVGDSRATEMGKRGEFTLGRYARERHGQRAVLVGMTTNGGSVTAAHDWGQPGFRRPVRPALDGSVENLLHSSGLPSAVFIPEQGSKLREVLSAERLERAIGVVYRPETERQSHYRTVRAAEEYDAIIHIDETEALEPLERTAEWQAGEPPETYPTAL